MNPEVLHKKINGSKSMEELEGVLGEVHEFARERSWLTAHAALRARKLQPYGGLGRAARILKPTARSLSAYASIWEKFKPLIRAYPRLSFSYFFVLYTCGVDKKMAKKLLDIADNETKTIREFSKLVEKKLSK